MSSFAETRRLRTEDPKLPSRGAGTSLREASGYKMIARMTVFVLAHLALVGGVLAIAASEPQQIATLLQSH